MKRKKKDDVPVELRKLRSKVQLESREERAAAKAARESTLPPEAQVPGLRKYYSFCHHRTKDMVRDCEKPARWLGLLIGISVFFTSYCDECKARDEVGRIVRRWWLATEEKSPVKRERINTTQILGEPIIKRVRLLRSIKVVADREDEE
jgi:hypothetical protein